MTVFLFGLIVFLGVHSVAIVAPRWREARVARNAGGWKGVYSVVSLVGFVLLVYGYGLARPTSPVLWTPPAGMRHVALLLMLPVFPLLIAAYVRGRIQRAVKHPMLLAVKFWALAHLLANGTVVDVILFGAFLAWAVADRISAKRRSGSSGRPASAPNPRNDVIAVVAGLAGYVLFLFWGHRWLIGVSPLG